MLEVGVKASSAQTHPESALSRSKWRSRQRQPFEHKIRHSRRGFVGVDVAARPFGRAFVLEVGVMVEARLRAQKHTIRGCAFMFKMVVQVVATL